MYGGTEVQRYMLGTLGSPVRDRKERKRKAQAGQTPHKKRETVSSVLNRKTTNSARFFPW
jgi:hypothetical protein